MNRNGARAVDEPEHALSTAETGPLQPALAVEASRTQVHALFTEGKLGQLSPEQTACILHALQRAGTVAATNALPAEAVFAAVARSDSTISSMPCSCRDGWRNFTKEQLRNVVHSLQQAGHQHIVCVNVRAPFDGPRRRFSTSRTGRPARSGCTAS